MGKSYKNTKRKMKSYPEFYRQVWLECLRIPRGEVRSYKDISISLGMPFHSRYVARALSANPFAPIIPCHRVIRSDGKIGGYSGKGGIKTKILLLKKEGIIIRHGKVVLKK